MSKKYDQLSIRMKGYEVTSRTQLTPRMPVIIRIDGCHFHTYTRGFDKPFDENLIKVFWETCKYLASNIMGAKMIYHQSDEISILLTNYDKLNTQSWFDNQVQKMTSVSASLATAKFNEAMRHYEPTVVDLATFDSRVFLLPMQEVTNYFIWRQQDCSKNSVSMLAQSLFSHKELQGVNTKQMQDKMFTEKGVNWNDLETWKKRGACIVKEHFEIEGGAQRSNWVVDKDIPIFTQDREYVDKFFMPEYIVE